MTGLPIDSLGFQKQDGLDVTFAAQDVSVLIQSPIIFAGFDDPATHFAFALSNVNHGAEDRGKVKSSASSPERQCGCGGPHQLDCFNWPVLPVIAK